MCENPLPLDLPSWRDDVFGPALVQLVRGKGGKHHNHWFHNTTFVNCHQKARREEADQAPPHEYERRAVNRQPGFRSEDS